MKSLLEIDAAIIRWWQSVYLWLLDYTGIYVGTLLAVLTLVSFSVWHFDWMDWINCALICLFWFAKWLLQYREEYALFNTLVESMIRLWGFRLGMILFSLLITFISVKFKEWQGIPLEGCWLIICYLQHVKIRKREPKEFFVRAPIPEAV